MQPLTQVSSGSQVVIYKIGGDAEEERHLQGIGIFVGGSVSVVRNSNSGQPLVLEIHGSRFMIEKEVAEQILVGDEND